MSTASRTWRKAWRRGAAQAAVLAVITLVLPAQAAEDVSVPKHVQVARDFLANTAPADNRYVSRGAMYTKAPGDFMSSKYVVNTDCKGFVADVVRRAYDYRMSFSGRSLGRGESSITDWVDGVENKGEGFDQIKNINDLKVGDYAMWSHEPLADNARGHIVMIDKPPRKLKTSRMEGLDQWEIYVIDSTGHAHSADDTRYVKGDSAAKSEGGYGTDGRSPNGVGTGRMYLYADADGTVKAVSNGFPKSTIQTTWHVVLGRVRVPN